LHGHTSVKPISFTFKIFISRNPISSYRLNLNILAHAQGAFRLELTDCACRTACLSSRLTASPYSFFRHPGECPDEKGTPPLLSPDALLFSQPGQTFFQSSPTVDGLMKNIPLKV